MYRLKMCVANIKHKTWWWNGKSYFEFKTIDELINFMQTNIPMDEGGYLNYSAMTCGRGNASSIIKRDSEIQNGTLANTSWYVVEKGKHQMTDYTSF